MDDGQLGDEKVGSTVGRAGPTRFRPVLASDSRVACSALSAS